MSGERKPGRQRKPAPRPATDLPEPTVFQPPGSNEGATTSSPRQRGEARSIKPGDLLNNTYEVRRFLARGGMGEVFEGITLLTEERVAIKVILPSRAADENVVAMFNKEARTLLKLPPHPALVRYKVLTEDPVLGVLYIVTDFIDGSSLLDSFGKITPTTQQLAALLRRLASGLSAAHAMGAIHRDISPDNVLLEGGRLEHARIIDFGIAKDISPGSATILGLGFAGKLEYVAPEQLGEFGGEVGPKADIYSLGLVILAAANGRGARMGGSWADAIDKRRRGPDLEGVPAPLKPIIARMVQHDPAQRPESMDAVIAELDRLGAGTPFDPLALLRRIGPPRLDRRTLLVGGGACAVAAVLVLALLLWPSPPKGAETGAGSEVAQPAPAPPPDPVPAARAAVETAVKSIGCSWLQVVDVGSDGTRPIAKLQGVADDPGRAQGDLARAVAAAGVPAIDFNFADVDRIDPRACGSIDAYRTVHGSVGPRITSAQRSFTMRMQGPTEYYHDQMAANFVANLEIGDPNLEMALVMIDPSGETGTVVNGRSNLSAALAASVAGKPLSDLGGDRFRMIVDQPFEGWTGLVLITASSLLDPKVISPDKFPDPAWRDRFIETARERHWNVDMLWLHAEKPAG